MKAAGVVALVTALAGCSDNPPGGDGECYAPLSEYCSTWPCPTYEQSLQQLRETADRFCFVAQAGSCGDLRFTRSGGGFGNTTLYFDSRDALVAVYATTDVVNTQSACPNWKHYGERLSCRDVIREDYCRR